ncbi:hypothetical protein ACQEVF_25170 [Nonomuraea polychroma]|uniref:hypothetical protein n=1 Tax=Nonomuraea polychroma TaxID=46176 RepID=UPI003D936442
MAEQLALPVPRRRRLRGRRGRRRARRAGRWVPLCDDCGRPIWSARSLKRRFGLLLGGRCYRKRARAARRLAVSLSTRIPVRPPGDIPGQLAITDSDQDQP